MVCFPSDAHKVGMMNTVPGMVKKSQSKLEWKNNGMKNSCK